MDGLSGVSITAGKAPSPDADKLPDFAKLSVDSASVNGHSSAVAEFFKFRPLEQVGTRHPPPLPHELHEDAGQVSFRLQGDPSMYTKEALERRSHLSTHVTIIACIDLFWNVVRGSSAEITRDQYITLHLRLTKALHREFHVHHARTLSMHEALKDLGQSRTMTKDMFRQALFEVVDLWTLQIDLHHYVDFLIQLFLRISELRPGIDPSVSIQELLQQMLSGDVADASSSFMQLRLLNNVALMEQGLDGDWTQHVPGSVRIDDLIASHASAFMDSPDGRPGWRNPQTKQQYLDSLKDLNCEQRKEKMSELLQKGLLSIEDILTMIQSGVLTPEELAALFTSNSDLLGALGSPAELFSRMKLFLNADVLAHIVSVLSANGIDVNATKYLNVKPRNSLIADIDSRLNAMKDISEELDDSMEMAPSIKQKLEPQPIYQSKSGKDLVHKATLIQSSRHAENCQVQTRRGHGKNSGLASELARRTQEEFEFRRDQLRYGAQSGPVYRKLKKELYLRLLQERIHKMTMEPSTMNGLGQHPSIVWDTDALSPHGQGDEAAVLHTSLPVIRLHNHGPKPLRPLPCVREAPTWKMMPRKHD